MTLGELEAILKGLKKYDTKYIVTVGFGMRVSYPHSYRGYYERIAFQPGDEYNYEKQEPITDPMNIVEFHTLVFNCLDKTFEGYKGGYFTMTKDTPVHIASVGSTGPGLVGIDTDYRQVILRTANTDWY